MPDGVSTFTDFSAGPLRSFRLKTSWLSHSRHAAETTRNLARNRAWESSQSRGIVPGETILVVVSLECRVYFGFAPRMTGSVSSSRSDLTMSCVPVLYFRKCGVLRCAS